MCAYFKWLYESSVIYLLIYVDNMLIANDRRIKISKLKALLNNLFERKDLGKARRIVGIDIIRNIEKSLLFLTYNMYII